MQILCILQFRHADECATVAREEEEEEEKTEKTSRIVHRTKDTCSLKVFRYFSSYQGVELNQHETQSAACLPLKPGTIFSWD